jgi:cobalt-zinc-cadmium resistance protein CzcA
MAQTVMLAIAGALILSLTYVPMMTALFLSKKVSIKKTIADRIISFFQRLYSPILQLALRFKAAFVLATIILFSASLWVFSTMGGEFIPTLEEGDLAMQQILPPGTSLTQSVEMTKRVQKKLLADFPEIEEVVTNIGAAEIPTDPMPVEIGDYTIVMKPKDEWTTADNRQDFFEEIEESMGVFPGVGLEFSQPIQLRFNELMTGAKADIAIKLYGADLDVAFEKAKEAERIIAEIPGTGTVNVEQTVGMPQILIDFNYPKMAQYGLQVKDVNRVVSAAFAGGSAGTIYEGERRFDLTVRLQEKYRAGIDNVADLYIPLMNGTQVPLQEVARVELVDEPMQISRENTNRRIVIGVNVGDTDVETLVGNIQAALDANVKLPPGYYFTYGGQFENLQAASARLMIAVPAALALIFLLLIFTFRSFSQAALIFIAIPLSAIGGILALELRGMPFSISAGIGFIALFGVAVLNGIVLIGYFNQLKKEGWEDVRARILEGTKVRLRPVIMTAAVASLGFLPMALSSSGGAEVQRPLATVVIGGLVTATFLTLIVLPIFYSWLEKWQDRKTPPSIAAPLLLLPFFLFPLGARAQVQSLGLEEAVQVAVSNNPAVRAADQRTDQSRSLQNLKYQPGLTDISYQGEGLFRENGQRVNMLTIVQEFPNPATIRAANAIQDVVVAGNLVRSQLTRAELTYQVRQTYVDLQQREALLLLYQQLTKTYSKYLRIANVRAESGAGNRLEALNLQASLSECESLAERTQLEITSLQRQLGSLLATNEPVTAADTFSLAPSPLLLDSTTAGLFVRLAETDVANAMAEITSLQAQLKPGFRLGYSAQQFFEGGYLTGLEAGITIPLFNKATKRRVETQRLGVTVAETQLEAERLRFEREQLATQSEIARNAAAADYYQHQLAVVNPEIIRISRLNYQAGEISYLELLNALKLLGTDSREYLNAVRDHNLAVARLRYLLNQ